MAFLLVATAPGPHRPCIGLHYMQSTSLFSSPGHILCTNGKNSYGAGDSLWVGLDAPWAASQQLQLEWHFYTWQSEAYVPPSTQTPVCPVGEGVLLLYWNYMAENSYSTRSPSVQFEIMAISKVCRRAKIMFLWVNFWKGSATPQVTTAFFPHLPRQQVWFHKPTPINHSLQPVSGAWQGVYVQCMVTITRSCEQTRLPLNNTPKKGFHGNPGTRFRWVSGLTSWLHLFPGRRKLQAPLQEHAGCGTGVSLLVANSRQVPPQWIEHTG